MSMITVLPMKPGITIVISITLFILSVALLVFPKTSLLARFSPQGTISPTTLTDEVSLEKTAIFNNKPVQIPSSIIAQLQNQPQELAQAKILGESTGPKRIEIDLTNQRLLAYEGDKMIYNFLISSGKWGKTPTGTFDIWIKLRSTRMKGGSKELHTYYNLPNVPYTMYFYNPATPKWLGFGIHGAYWHNNFGHPMSHGCINMKPEEAGLLYEWAQPSMNGKNTMYASAENPGTQIVIYGTAPNS